MDSPESQAYYRAMLARDRRFDGRFFVGVHTTGIYCRPICPARKPLFKNVSFYLNAAAAEEAGFRPCFRCRPESSPGSPAWAGTSTSVARALRLMTSGSFEENKIESLGDRLGIGERQLRRLFLQHLGAPPLAILRTRRLDFARRLLDQTRLPVSEIAFVSGFSSLRRFNDAFKKRFRRSPSEARKLLSAPAEGILLRLPYRPPFHWGALLDFLRQRELPGVESIDGETYLRAVDSGWVEITHDEKRAALVVKIQIDRTDKLMDLTDRVKRLFDLEADPLAIENHLAKEAAFKKGFKLFPGLRVPGAWDGFEIGVRTILGQQVSVAGARTLAGRVIAQFGKPFHDHPRLKFIFPTAESLVNADLGKIGIPGARASAIRRFASEIHSGRIRLDETVDPEEMKAKLLKIPGFGPWTVNYIAMRALRDPDAFPAADLIIKREVTQKKLSPEKWHPWRAYATMYLWKMHVKGSI